MYLSVLTNGRNVRTRRKVAFGMTTLTAIACNGVSQCIDRSASWRGIFWLVYWVRTLS